MRQGRAAACEKVNSPSILMFSCSSRLTLSFNFLFLFSVISSSLTLTNLTAHLMHFHCSERLHHHRNLKYSQLIHVCHRVYDKTSESIQNTFILPVLFCVFLFPSLLFVKQYKTIRNVQSEQYIYSLGLNI